MLGRLFCSFLLLFVGNGFAQQKEIDSSRENDLVLRLDSLINSKINQDKIPSIALGVVKDGEQVIAKGYGLADLETRRKADSSTIYQLGSVTKMLTGHVLASLIHEGKLSVTDPLMNFFPDSLNFPKSPTGQLVRIKQLATHSSGFPRYPHNLNREDPHPITGYDYSQMLEAISSVNLDTVIGARYQYSNFGFGVLGTAMENLTGEPLARLMESTIFSKYGMINSSLEYKQEFNENLATPYLQTTPIIKTEPWAMGKLAAAGNAFSSINDLNALMIEMLRENEMNRIQQQRYFSINNTWSYGLGCFIVDSEQRKTTLVYHGGDIDGYASSLTLYPEYGLGIVILTNWGEGQSIGAAFQGIYSIVTDYFFGKISAEVKK